MLSPSHVPTTWCHFVLSAMVAVANVENTLLMKNFTCPVEPSKVKPQLSPPVDLPSRPTVFVSLASRLNQNDTDIFWVAENLSLDPASTYSPTPLNWRT